MKQPEDQPAGFRYVDPACKMKFVYKMLYPIKSNGFQQLRMDDIARHMDISKATLYKYFSSKEEIVSLIVDMYISDIVELYRQYLDDASISYADRFQRTFTQTMMVVNYGSEPFLNDLRDSAPDLYERFETAAGERNAKLKAFYEDGIAAGAFHRLDATLLVLQDEVMFRHLIAPVNLMKYNLTLRNALCDYYQMRRTMLLTPEAAAGCDDKHVNEKMDMLVKKIMFGMV